jgi:hypothetical protein
LASAKASLIFSRYVIVFFRRGGVGLAAPLQKIITKKEAQKSFFLKKMQRNSQVIHKAFRRFHAKSIMA